MDRGFIKIFRKLSDNPLWMKKPFSDGQAWVDLLMIANHKAGIIDKRGLRVKVERGQVGYSTKGLADRWGWSRGKVNRFLKYLENEQQIEQQINNVTTLITLKNYETYNVSDTKTSRKRTADEPQTDTNKNEEKGKKELFVKFWGLYPKKESKKKSEESWMKLSDEDQQIAITSLPNHIKSRQWVEGFIPMAVTWLNQRRFDDELTETTGTGSGDNFDSWRD